MRQLIRRLKMSERGVNLVEFALITSALLLLVMGILEFGRLYSVNIQITNGAREGARAAAVGNSESEIEARVQAVSAGLNSANLSVTTTNAEGPAGEYVTVEVDYPVTLVVPLIADFFPQNPVPLNSTVTMRLE